MRSSEKHGMNNMNIILLEEYDHGMNNMNIILLEQYEHGMYK